MNASVQGYSIYLFGGGVRVWPAAFLCSAVAALYVGLACAHSELNESTCLHSLHVALDCAL